MGWGTTAQRFSGVRGPNVTKLGEDILRSSLHKKFVSEFGIFNVGGSKLSDSQVMLKTTPNFALFDPPPPPVKIHLMAIYCAASERVGLIKKEVHG